MKHPEHLYDKDGWSVRVYGNKQRDHITGASVWFFDGTWKYDRADCEEKYRTHPLGEDAPADGTAESEEQAKALALAEAAS